MIDIEKVHQMKKSGTRIGFTCSTAELAHPGFIDMLLQAKQDCDFLIFGLLTDPTISRPDSKNKPVETTFERWVRLSAIKYIDMIIPFDTEEDLVNMIILIQPTVRFVGEEYKGTEHTGWNLCPIIYNTRKHNWSSSGLRQKIYELETTKLQIEINEVTDELEPDKTELIKVPATLDECYNLLDQIEGLDKWLKLPERDAITTAHHGIGRVIRNEWGLWSSSDLKDFFVNWGVTHPDDMSSIILTSYHRYKNNKPLDIIEQINYFKKFWSTPEEERYGYVTRNK
jgi:glycerol-3-phosphate cytidylyltransferase